MVLDIKFGSVISMYLNVYTPLVLGPHIALFRAYSLLCAQESIIPGGTWGTILSAYG